FLFSGVEFFETRLQFFGDFGLAILQGGLGVFALPVVVEGFAEIDGANAALSKGGAPQEGGQKQAENQSAEEAIHGEREPEFPGVANSKRGSGEARRNCVPSSDV